MKKSALLFVLTALFITLITLPVGAEVTSGTCGANLTWTLDNSGTLTISGTGSMYNYKNSRWESSDFIKKIVVKEGVTSIGGYAFYDCYRLTSVSLPKGLTSIKDYAFYDCSSLTSISLPEELTSIGNYAFSGCESLTSISLPKELTSIGYGAFSGCSSLTSISLPKGLTVIGDHTFSSCSSLTNISLPEGLTSIEDDAFSGCESLTSISLPKGLTSIGRDAFFCCSGLTSISLPEGITSIKERTFTSCRSLTNISLPKGLTSIEIEAFKGCANLTSISLPKGLTSIQGSTFANCENLTNVFLPKGITSISHSAFTGCKNLKNIHYEGTQEKWNEIVIENESNELKNANIIFGSTSLNDYTIFYSTNGGTGKIEPQTFSVGTEGVITDQTPDRPGYIFLGWAADKNATAPEYASGDTYNGNAGITLYAVWEEIPYYNGATKTVANVSDGQIILSVQAAKPVTTDQQLHIALYSKNNRFLDYIIVPTIREFTETNIVFQDNVHAATAKVFLWNSLESMEPIAGAEIVKIR